MFIFPMAGLSSRFVREGYGRPKHELPLFGRTVFAQVVRSFERYFNTDPFVFIHRGGADTASFICRELQSLGVRDTHLVSLSEPTDGQAHTVRLGLKMLTVLMNAPSDDSLFIFNVDTIRPNFLKPDFLKECDGYLEVFVGEGERWSFVDPGEGGVVLRTEEKIRISNLCSNGLYFFRHKTDFERIFDQAEAENERSQGEYYVAPLYNRLIAEGARILYDMVSDEDLMFCGTPSEYEHLQSNRKAQHRLCERIGEP